MRDSLVCDKEAVPRCYSAEAASRPLRKIESRAKALGAPKLGEEPMALRGRGSSYASAAPTPRGERGGSRRKLPLFEGMTVPQAVV